MIKKFRKKKDQYLQHKTGYTGIISLLTVFVLIMVISIAYISHMQNLIYKNVYQNISELSEQTAVQLEASITEQKNIVRVMTDTIEQGHFTTEEEIFARYSSEIDRYHFTRLVILDKQGNGITSDNHEVKNYHNIEEFFKEEDVYLSDNRPSTVSDNQVNIYSKTFELNGEEKVLMATINTSDYKEILLRRLFGKGGTDLINDEGIILLDGWENDIKENTNLYDYIRENYAPTNEKENKKIEKMKEAIERGEVGTFHVNLNGEIYFIHYEKMNINNWYVITSAANSTIALELMNLIILSAMLCLFIILVIMSISVYINISNKKKNNKLYRVAYIDPVTLLGNEYYFRANGTIYLEGNITKNKYVVTIDINKFKALNNIYGYAVCNEILKTLGQKIQKLLPPNNITCRISNDIFASIFSYDDNIEELLHKVFVESSSLNINGMELHVNLAIGAYNILPNEMDINKIIDKAYLARAEIKGLYHSNYYLFDETLENRMIEEQKIEACMEEALENNEFKVFYQPKVYTKNEKMSGAEALVRWYRNGEFISPGKFIPLFEKNKFIVKLDKYIFEQVCKDLADWRDRLGFMPTVSVNVSREQFVDENFIDKYVDICTKYGLEPSAIDLEITESANTNMDVLKVLSLIKAKGFTISIDDFGTGTSSLSMLQNMPIDIMKIDKIFVDKANLESDKNIINYIVLIAHHLNVATIVEGVETKEQVEFIKKIGGDIIQGYYYSKPIPKDEFEEYFNKNM
ncbi:MAG: GGDEF domain-containing protein [Clostridia bacterium]|nr:GGDEF domain-containing protein [Clostridia bacterium]